MKTIEFCDAHNACKEGREWAMSVSPYMADVWDALVAGKLYDWLLWVVRHALDEHMIRKLACRFVRETPLPDGRMVWDLLTDERSRRAVEVAEIYASGMATADELSSASASARDAAWDLASARYAARAAAWAAALDWDAARCAARDAARASSWYASLDAQITMIAEIGNPFKEDVK